MKNYDINIPSQRIRFALEALVKFENLENTRVSMVVYHDAVADICWACLGGAAAIELSGVPISDMIALEIASTSKLHKHQNYFHTQEGLAHFEESLDYIRVGSLGTYLFAFGSPQLGIDGYDIPNYLEVENYHSNRTLFIEDLTNIADRLEQYGI